MEIGKEGEGGGGGLWGCLRKEERGKKKPSPEAIKNSRWGRGKAKRRKRGGALEVRTKEGGGAVGFKQRGSLVRHSYLYESKTRKKEDCSSP